MQLGFNTNFRYRDVVFHVQTEDSGRANPHVITHVFHGGSIIASRKSDYSDLLVEADLEESVRRLMETQHKAMLKELSRGELDAAIRERLGAGIFAGEETDRGASGAAAGPVVAARTATGGDSAARAATRQSASPAGRAGGRASASSAATPAVRPSANASAERTAAGSERRDSSSGLARVFGERVVSEKPLDEVVLDYLVENARKRKRTPKS